MGIKQLFRSPLLWVSFAILALLLGTNSMNASAAAKEVDTWKIIEDIQQGRAKSAILVDNDQLIKVTLTDDTNQTAEFITGQAPSLISLFES